MLLIDMDEIFGTDYQGIKRFDVMKKSDKADIRRKIILSLANNIIADYEKVSERQIKAAKIIKHAISTCVMSSTESSEIAFDWAIFENTDWNSVESIAYCISQLTTEAHRDNENMDKWLLTPYIIKIEGVSVI